MKLKNVINVIVAIVLVAVVGVVAVLGWAISERYSALHHAPAYSLEAPEPALVPAQPQGDVDTQALGAQLSGVAANSGVGAFHGRVTDISTGEVVWDNNSSTPLQPASATKLLTASAAVLELPAEKVLTTEVVEGQAPGSLVIRAAGDVWLDAEALDELAEQIQAAGTEYTSVAIDTSVWEGATSPQGWDPADIDGGYTAPLVPAMIHAGRIGATQGDVPRSHTPALDVAAAVAQRIGAEPAGQASAPADAGIVASVDSPPLSARLEEMVKESDNVMAEAIGRELAIATGAAPTIDGAVQATLDALAAGGFDVTGVHLADNSGLSVNNLIPPRLLDDLLVAAATEETLRPVLQALPVAAGAGTLTDRYADRAGRGWVRAKTGTLTGTNALAGTVTAQSGHIYTFGLLANDADALTGRAALDEFASVLRSSG